MPYLYVGSFPSVAPGAFWNEPFDAGRAVTDIASVDDALGFLREDRARTGDTP